MIGYLLTHTPLFYLVQSLWRDEAFSVLAAERPLSFIVGHIGFEPPVYYTLLHFWMKLFGEGEIAVRFLSVIGFTLATVIVIEWADVLYKKHWLAWFTPLFFFLNPMLLYYAFEVRTYAWYMFFATASLYTYATKRWKWFAISSVLGFYTHLYFLPYFAVLGIHWIATNWQVFRKNIVAPFKTAAGVSFLVSALLMVPWLIKVGMEFGIMKSSWYYPVDIQLVKSVLGNMFLGYEGTPWYGWKYTAYLSLGILLLSVNALLDKKNAKQTILFAVFSIVPLALIVGISFMKPLYVNRYLIPTTIGEVFVIIAGIAAIKNPLVQKLAAGLMLLGVLWFNGWYPLQHAKPTYRQSFEQINAMVKLNDIVMAENPLNYLETLYYTKDRSRVYLYNPNNGVFAWYIGDALISPSRMLKDYPVYPSRAILVHQDTTYEFVYRMPL